MKTALTILLFGIVALAGGFALIVAADRFGWLPGDASSPVAANGSCPHEIPGETCPFCHPELIESMGWCGGHDVAEALCTRCNVGLIPAFEARGDWCVTHGLPESQCLICLRPASTGEPAAERPDAAGARAGAGVMRVNRPPSPTCTTSYTTVQLASPAVARRAGLRVETLEKQSVPEVVTCNADVAFNGGRYAHLASRAPGIITEVRVDLGATVDAGEVLAVVDSSDIGSAKAAFLQARSLVDLWEKTHAREQSLFEQNVGTERDVLEAETRLVESRVQLGNARQRLQNLGLSERDLEVVAETNDTSSMLPLRAAFPGIVVERHAVPGEVVTTARSLFAVADTQTMWVMLDVYETDVARLERGQRVTMRVDAMPDRTFTGELTWISAEVDRRTRTIQARAEVENPDGLLRANMFGRAEITVRTIEEAVLVPASAVQWDGCCNVVFVRHTDTIYQPYKVTLGYKQGERFVVEDGVPAGEAVVTQGSFLLKTEILKGNIGAGCCEVDPGANQ
ncbi:MAG: efflux RND transporter periplasmic adaptor subunit [Phycisphaerales bacterium]|nr:efflux RND transporter periplasmic adaptor subunit [Phycisphaerales bacterium]